jgi:hypothetical protein
MGGLDHTLAFGSHLEFVESYLCLHGLNEIAGDEGYGGEGELIYNIV